jgi:biopolymer transport protein TolR
MAFGRLERNSGPQPMSDINMTPLIDVMLVLLVIFIITAPLLASSIRLDLPQTPAASASNATASLMLTVDRSGQAFLNDKPVSAADLATELASASAIDPDTELQLRADAAVPYGRVVEIMGIAQKAGLGRIGFVAEQADKAR